MMCDFCSKEETKYLVFDNTKGLCFTCYQLFQAVSNPSYKKMLEFSKSYTVKEELEEPGEVYQFQVINRLPGKTTKF